MGNIKSTIWEIEPHTVAKHRILEEYLKAWFPILGRHNERILYLDGFAGPGKYSNNEDGSPIIAIKTALHHPNLKNIKIFFMFIEKDKDRLASLKSTILEKFPNLPTNFTIKTFGSSFQEILMPITEQIKSLIPAFVFIDPFGYSDFPMKIIHDILKYRRSEILITFMTGFLKRFIEIPEYKVIFDKLFGDSGWEKFNTIGKEEKENFLINYYVSKIKEKAKYVRHFEMRDESDRIIYHLVFGTNNLRGLEVMKGSMFKVDKLQEYKFSDSTDPKQAYLIDYFSEKYWIQKAGNDLLKNFNGKMVDLDQIKEYTLVNTPYVFRKEILSYLEKQTKIEVYNRNRKNTYPDGCKIKFIS